MSPRPVSSSTRPVRRGPRDRLLGPLLGVVLVAVTTVAVPVEAGPPWSTPDRVDETVLDWNRYAVESFAIEPTPSTPGAAQPPPVAILHVAMVQLAMYDAVVAIEGGYEPYGSDPISASPQASTAAAAATAAHRTMVGVEVFPPLGTDVVERLDQLHVEAIADARRRDGRRAVRAGVRLGAATADRLLSQRADDGRYGSFTFSTGTAIGEWRPTPPTDIIAPFAWVARVDPFVLESTSQFRTRGPLPIDSVAYAREYREVQALGGPDADGARSDEQQAVAEFFYDIDVTEIMNRTFRGIAQDRRLTPVEQARLFAMANTAAADAVINCFDDKAFWGFWRPITAINQGNLDTNPRTTGDPDWIPRNVTPPYPEHPSGYNCVTAGFVHAAEAFFGPRRTTFELVHVVPDGPDVTRTYDRFRDVLDDTIDARIYHGLHFRTADEQGAWIGRSVAHWHDRHAFRPIRGHRD